MSAHRVWGEFRLWRGLSAFCIESFASSPAPVEYTFQISKGNQYKIVYLK